MLTRLRMVWVAIRDSLWFAPGALTLCAAALAFAITGAERRELLSIGDRYPWLFGGGVDGAREVLSAIAGGLITVTGVVFSVTIVALQLASSQFTPRVLRNFTADRSNQLVLGVFIGTFTYALLVLRTVHSGGDQDEPFIPRVAVTLAVLFVLVSIGFLIFFINHAARSIQVATVLDRVTDNTLAAIRRLFPDDVGRADAEEVPDPHDRPRETVAIAAARSGYLQAVDAEALFRLAACREAVIAMDPQVGDYLLTGEPLASVWPLSSIDDEMAKGIRDAFVLGRERTPHQDVEFGIIEIGDIAVKALSPGINDPTTALRCIDRLSELLLVFANRHPPQPQRTEAGNIHFIARHTSFERLLGLAFDQITHFGSSNPTIVKRLLDVIARLRRLVPDGRRVTLDGVADAVARAARSSLDPDDRASMQELLEGMRT